FQAEDGIRDFHVTGVQTCALPILPAASNRCSSIEIEPSYSMQASVTVARWIFPERNDRNILTSGYSGVATCRPDAPVTRQQNDKIGRASCREREQSKEGEGVVIRR